MAARYKLVAAPSRRPRWRSSAVLLEKWEGQAKIKNYGFVTEPYNRELMTMAADKIEPFQNDRQIVTRGFRRTSTESPRFSVETPCLYSFGRGPECKGTVLNLSRGGCTILGTSPVRDGDCLRVLLYTAADYPPIEIGLAPVRWITNELFGVDFLTLRTGDAHRLEKHLKSLNTQ